MASGTALVFDPAKTATTTAQAPPLSGGGLVGGNGTFYSAATEIGNLSLVSEAIFLTGTIAGTLTCEVDNTSPDADQVGVGARWQTYDKVNGGGFANGVATLVGGAIAGGTNPGGWESQRPVSWRRYRLKLIVTSGTGTIEVRRSVKGLW